MKSIRRKITICLMLTVLAAQIFVGAVSISLNYTSTIATVDQMMCESAALAAGRVEQELLAYENVAADTGCISQLSIYRNKLIYQLLLQLQSLTL